MIDPFAILTGNNHRAILKIKARLDNGREWCCNVTKRTLAVLHSYGYHYYSPNDSRSRSLLLGLGPNTLHAQAEIRSRQEIVATTIFRRCPHAKVSLVSLVATKERDVFELVQDRHKHVAKVNTPTPTIRMDTGPAPSNQPTIKPLVQMEK